MSKQVDDILEGLRQPLFSLGKELVKLQECIVSLEHDHKLMRETLEKYADDHQWCYSNNPEIEDWWMPDDNGYDLARTALSSLLVKDGE